jgi:hypothetical protein
MSVDFVALAKAVVAGVADVRVCLIVSRDGLALGACPVEQEEKALAVWSQVATLGEVERCFVALRDEVWAFSRRGPYAALATAGPAVRPGLLLDSLEQMLLTAEEGRLRKDGNRAPPEKQGSADTTRRPRSSLHPEAKEERPAATSLEEAAVSAWLQRVRGQVERNPATPAPAKPAAHSAPSNPASAPTRSGEERAWTVDRGALSLEFRGLLGLDDREDEEA